jgi:hypothetical protein
MSILRVNNIERATSGSNTVTFTDDVMFTGAVNISSGSITASFDIANASIQKEKLTNDARDWANILNRPAGIISSSGQLVSALSGSSLQLGGISATGSIRTTDVFSGSGAQLFGIPNTALNNSQITINGTSVALGGSRTLTTADVGESGNLYYTDARVKAKMNADGIVSQSNQINYQSITGQPTVNTLGGDGNQAFTITTGLFVTASGGADGIIVTNDAPNFTLRFRTVGGTVSSSAQIKTNLPNGTVSSSAQYPGWVTSSAQINYNNIQNKLSGVYSSSAFTAPNQGTLRLTLNGVALTDVDTGLQTSDAPTFTTITASALSSNQAVFTNAGNGLVSNPITGTGNVVMSTNPTLTGTITAQNITATGTMLLAGIISQSSQVDYNLITNKLSGVVSSSTQVKPLLPGGTVTSSAQYPGWVTASSQIDYNSIQNKLSGVVSSSAQVQPLLPAGTVSSSVQVKANLPAGTVSASGQVDVRNTTGIATIATTGSNTFRGNQIVSGTLFVTQDFIVQGSSSLQFITSSVVIGANTILLNADTPALRYAGIEVFDSGSTGVSASLLYDSVNNDWVFVHKDSGTEDASVLLYGPLSTNGLGTETKLTANYITKVEDSGHGHHLTTSSVFDNGSLVRVNNNTQITGSLHVSAGVSGAFQGTFPYASLTGIPSALVSSSVISSPNQGTVRLAINGSNTDVDTGLQTADSPTFAGLTVTTTSSIAGHYSSSAQVIAALVNRNVSVANVSASGHIVPSTTDIYDLGSPTLRFRDLYLSGSTLYLGTLAISDTGGALSVRPSGSPAGTNSPISGAFTGSFRGNGNQLTNISNAALPGGIISSSAQLPAGTISSSAQYPGWVTSSAQINYNNIQNKLSGTVSSSIQVKTLLPADTVSSSGQINAGATANFATAVAAQLGGVHSASFLGTATTNNLAEGVTNLYYTDARVKTKISADNVHSASFLGTATTDNLTQGSTNKYYANSLVLSYIDSLSVLSSSQQVVNRLPTGTVSSSTQIAAVQVNSASYAETASLALGVSGSLAVNTDGLPEGVTNLYYTDARVKTKLNVENVHSSSFLGTATTTNLTEGINLYFTNDRVKAALPGVVSSSTQVSILIPAGTVSSSAQIDYNNIQNKLSGVVSSSTQIKPLLPANTVTSSTQVTAFLPGGTVSSSGQVDITATTGYATFSSSLATVDATQQVSLNALNAATSSYALQSQLAGVVSSSTQVKPLLPDGTVSSSIQVDYNSITNKLSGVFSSSAQTVASLAGQNITPSGSNFQGIVSGSGNQYRLVVPVGTNLYAS